MIKRLSDKNWLLPLAFSAFLILFIYRSVLLNFSTNLSDQFDFPYYAWALNHTMQFISGSHSSLFTTNIFYPFQNSYFFSDMLLPQALVGLIPYLLGANPISVTNFIVIGTLILNTIAAIYLWKNWFKNTWILTFMTLVTALSPFVLMQRGHLQMVTIWPFLLIFRLLLSNKKTYKSAISIGVLWAIQLLASAYLAIFLIICIGWMALLELLHRPTKKKVLIFYAILGATALLLGGPILIKYKLVQQQYGVEISYGEYLTYNAHLTDYLFIPYQTIGQQATAKWQALNFHNAGEVAMYPGISLLGLAVFGLLQFKKPKNRLQVELPLNIEHLFFLGLILIGFIFSLGPRLFVNGVYAQLPLPYAIPLKIIPLFTAIRATARWSWLVYIGLSYFAGLGLSKIKNKKHLVFISCLAILLYVIEIIPTASASKDLKYALDANAVVTRNCQEDSKSLAIVPFTQQDDDSDLYTNLSRKTAFLLQSTQHNCQLVNGYGGFEPPEYKQLEQELNAAIDQQDITAFTTIARKNNIEVVLLDSQFLSSENKEYVDTFFSDYQKNDKNDITILEQEPGSWYLVSIQ